MSTSSSSEPQDNTSYWADLWAIGDIGWHSDSLNLALAQYGETFLGPPTTLSASGNSEQTSILFPLCGKSKDMIILGEKQYKIAGIEGVKAALDDFATENNSVLITQDSDIPPYEKFTMELSESVGEGKPVIDLYLGDFFARLDKINTTVPQQQFDRIFDRGSLVAIDPSLREPYMLILNSMLKTGGKWMIVGMEYNNDPVVYEGPPYSLGESSVQKLVAFIEEKTGDKYAIDVVHKMDGAEAGENSMHSRFLVANGGCMPSFIDNYFVITKL